MISVSQKAEVGHCVPCSRIRKTVGMALIFSMGAFFLGVWLIPATLREWIPVLSAMGVNTSISLLLAGMALVLPQFRGWLGVIIAVFGATVLMQYIFSWVPSDGPWHYILNVDNRDSPWIGRMAPLTALSFLCAGLALSMFDRAQHLFVQIFLQLAPGIILAAAVGGALNRILNGLLFVVTLDGYAVMGLSTMAALSLFVFGYLAALFETAWFRRFYASREERQVLAIGLSGFTAALLLGGAASIAVLGKQIKLSIEDDLTKSVQTQATIFSPILSTAWFKLHTRVDGVMSSGADLSKLLRDLAGEGGSAWLEREDGSTGEYAGLAPDKSQFRVRLNEERPAWLTWNHRWMLETRVSLVEGGGSIVIQEPQPVLESYFEDSLGRGIETRLCAPMPGKQIACFPSAFMSHPSIFPATDGSPMMKAIKGQQGVTIMPDYRGVKVVAAYVPVTDPQLGMVRKIDAELIYQPIRIAVWKAIVIIAVVSLLAAFLIYLRVRLVVRRAAESGRQLRGVLDALPVGVWLTDAQGKFILNNPAGSRIWCGERWPDVENYDVYKGWWYDTGERIEARDWALARAIERGETSLDEVIEIECFDGSRKIINNSALPLRDENDATAGAIVVVKDITARIHADEEIRRLEREFHSLAENLPDIVIRFGKDLRCTYVNPEIEKSMSISRYSLLGKTCDALGLSEEALHTWFRALSNAFISSVPEPFEYQFTYKSGMVRYFYTRAVPEYDETGKVASILTISRDISAIKIAEAALREGEERFYGITSNVPGMVFQCCLNENAELQFTYISNGAEWLLGVDAAAIEGDAKLFLELIAPEDVDSFHESMMRSQGDLSLWNWEGRFMVAGARMIWVNLRATPRLVSKDVCIWDGVAINITEGKTNEEKLINTQHMLRKLAAHLESVREVERKRIAREMHDELGQRLTALRMEVSLMRLNFGDSNPELMPQLKSMMSYVDRAIETTRHVTTRLRPGALDLGIVAAVEWLIEEFTGYMDVPCELVLEDEEIQLSEFTEVAVFRIIQESLTNVARHADATQVKVVLSPSDTLFCFEIIDNGRGFETPKEGDLKSLGLTGMRERVSMLEGHFELDSQPGKGTRIRVCIPVE